MRRPNSSRPSRTEPSAPARRSRKPPADERWRVLHQPSDAPPDPWHRRRMVSLRLRLLRQHAVPPSILKGGLSPRQLWNRSWPGRSPSSWSSPFPATSSPFEDGPHRTPSSAVHRLRRYGWPFLALGMFPALRPRLSPFLLVFGLSYFFVEFGPNTTTFVLPSEVFPVNMRTPVTALLRASGSSEPSSEYFSSRTARSTIELRGMLLVGRRSRHSRLPPHRAASRAGVEEPGRDIWGGGGRCRSVSPSRSIRWRGRDIKTHHPGQHTCRQSTSSSRGAVRHCSVNRARP